MAQFIWLGTVSDSLTAAGNYAGGVAPTGISSNQIVVSGEAQRGIQSNVVQPTWDIQSFEVQPGFSLPIGSSTSKLTFACGTFTDSGGGETWLDANNSGGANNIDKLIIDKSDANTPIYLYDSGDQITRVDAMRGLVYYRCVNGGTINIAYHDLPSTDVVMYLDGGTMTTKPDVYKIGGRLIVSAANGTVQTANLWHFGGMTEFLDFAAWSGNGANIAYLYLEAGTVVFTLPLTTAYSLTLSQAGIKGYGGIFDMSGCETRFGVSNGIEAWPGFDLVDHPVTPKLLTTIDYIGR